MIYKDNIPFFKKGLSLPQVIFSGGRITASLAAHGGVTDISYFGPSPGNVKFFKADPLSVWTQLFRQYIDINGKLYYVEFNDTTIHPYGYKSHFCVDGVKICHQLTLLNDALCFSMRILEKKASDMVRMKLILMSEVTEVRDKHRTWESFSHFETENIIVTKVIDTLPENSQSILQSGAKNKKMLTQHPLPDYIPLKRGETYIGLTSDQKLEFTFSQRLGKVHIQTCEFEHESNISILFGTKNDDFQQRLLYLSQFAQKERNECIRIHAEKIKKQPRFNFKNKTLQSMMSCFPSVIESLKVKDIPGGMRAADCHYWIWGWDNMVHSDANMLANDYGFVSDMLKFYKTNSHPEFGIFHALGRDGKPSMGMATAAQCIYSIMLYRYYIFSRDNQTLDELYPFAVELVKKAMMSEVNDSGLIEGVSLFPDIPDDLGQDGNDISIFNNSIFYQGMRCVEELAEVTGNIEDKMLFQSYSEKFKTSFDKYFFDTKKGYYVDSISSVDFSKRYHYPVYAILWLTHFAKELVEKRIHKLAYFMKNNFPHRFGQAMFPRWDTQVEVEGNQLGFNVPQHESFYIPVVEGFYREIQRLAGYRETTLPKIMETCWKQISIPEGIDCEAINNGIILNKLGQKQLFCLTAWYSLFFRNLLGLEFKLDGLSISNSLLQDSFINVSNIHFGNKNINLTIHGNGNKITRMVLNEIDLYNNFIEFVQLESENHLILWRN